MIEKECERVISISQHNLEKGEASDSMRLFIPFAYSFSVFIWVMEHQFPYFWDGQQLETNKHKQANSNIF